VLAAWKDRLVRWASRLRPALPYLPATLVVSVLAYHAIKRILDRAGHPAVPLDDAFIHFQFARNLAHGQLFHYSPGDGYVAGATSFLWPVLFAPFYLIGFDDLSILWVAWLLGFAAHAALVVETYRLADKLTGRAVATGAAAMTALFGGFVWFAASGMETVPLAWILARTARVASEWCESAPEARTPRVRNQLIALGVIAPLVRPEGALASAFAAAALLGFAAQGPSRSWKRWLVALTPLLGPLLLPAMNLLFSGSASSTTTLVKWLPMSPYYPTLSSVWEPIRGNLHVMFSTLLDGQEWSAVFVPKGALPVSVAALVSIPLAGWRARRPWRSLFVLVLALAMLLPCTYHTFLWNRLRYLWPFIPGWFVGLACACKLFGDAAAQVRARWVVVAPVLAGVAAGTLLGNVSWSMDDLSKSAAAIDQQQVALGRWANENLPQDAIIGVNDTGAIAYFSRRRTFDIVGLTTQGEARYWLAGAGSRFEHYERMVNETPDRFPTHFIVYSNWMSCEPVLGKRLHEASVYDQTILGGVTMIAYEARRDLLGSGARPITEPVRGSISDELDVADLISEDEHGYRIEHGGKETSNTVHADFTFRDGKDVEWADGGRFLRTLDVFEAHLPAGVSHVGIARLKGSDASDVEVVIESGAQVLVTARIPSGRAEEVTFTVPANVAAERTPMQVRALGGATFGSLHYWFVRE
jgi:hypothetical protein